MDLGDGGGGQWLAFERGEHLVHLGTELRPQRLLDPGPRDLGRVILQAAQFGDELGREKVAAGREHLPELDERDPAVFEGEAQRAGQPAPAFGGAQLGPAPAPLVRQQAAPHQDVADLRVAAHPADLPPGAAEQVERPGQGPARHQRLGDDEEDHADQKRDDHAQDHEPQARQGAGFPVRHRGAAHGRDDRRGDEERDEASRQRAQDGQRQADQPAYPEGEDQHGQRGRDRHQGDIEGRHDRFRSARAGRDLGIARLPCGVDEGVRNLVRTRI